ncbi:MAG: glycosyltransferase [Phycisphaeraceae bacterium]|nr:glycosyltransferase [Phycisphaeraceae bacterium]
MTRALVFAGGGTGGHIFPALAIAEHLGSEDGRSPVVHVVCSVRALDARILAANGVAFTPIPAAPPSAHPKRLVRFLRSWGPSVRTSRALLRSLREAHGVVVVVAMGGYVAAPVVQAARVERCPVVLVNLDAAPGKANRWIARHAEHIFTSAPVDRNGWERVPPIVRSIARASDTPANCRESLGLAPDRPTLLVTGASQGARSINRFMAAFAARHASTLEGWQVVHQSGPEGEEELVRAYAEADIAAVVAPFFESMGQAWGAADLAISRAGAGSVGEVWANGVPTVFMPYPYHRDQHQRLNAAPLESVGGCVICADRIEPEANLTDAGTHLARLLGDSATRASMRSALASLGPADGAQRIAQSPSLRSPARVIAGKKHA